MNYKKNVQDYINASPGERDVVYIKILYYHEVEFVSQKKKQNITEPIKLIVLLNEINKAWLDFADEINEKLMIKTKPIKRTAFICLIKIKFPKVYEYWKMTTHEISKLKI